MNLTPNQVVAYNLRRARQLHRWTQDIAAKQLEPYLGERWSRAVYSSAERSITGQRIRQFTADEITAFAAAFELPVAYFFQPPPDADAIANQNADASLSPEKMTDELVNRPIRASVEQVNEKALEELEQMGVRVHRVPYVAPAITTSKPGDRPGLRGKDNP